jgi:hypothetical protein
MDDHDWKQSAISWYRDLAEIYFENAEQHCWDDHAKRGWRRLADWQTREASRLEQAREHDVESERRRFEDRRRRLADIGYRIFDRYLHRLSSRWVPSEAQEKAAISMATDIADWSGMTVIGPLTVVFEKETWPRRWTISYFAQSRYRGGMIRTTVGYKMGRLLGADVEIFSGRAGRLLELPPA